MLRRLVCSNVSLCDYLFAYVFIYVCKCTCVYGSSSKTIRVFYESKTGSLYRICLKDQTYLIFSLETFFFSFLFLVYYDRRYFSKFKNMVIDNVKDCMKIWHLFSI